MVQLYENGKPRAAIVEEYDLTASALDRWINRFNPLKIESFSLIFAFSYASSLLQPPRSLGRKTPSVKEIT
ncbi:helix-turn-helix domain-containing protein [Brevibacillus agri]|uniref:helix-turn-helix domain-containing protein n=2 Tax=Brevibacillus TaxID=55080 RepID=UPI003D9A12C4